MTTETDRELLTLAAYAVGLEDAVWCEDQNCINYERTDRKHFRRATFNSLTNKADAFDLMVKLKIDVETGQETIVTWCDTGEFYSGVQSETLGNNPEAATMLAITRAAAAIGKQMKE